MLILMKEYKACIGCSYYDPHYRCFPTCCRNWENLNTGESPIKDYVPVGCPKIEMGDNDNNILQRNMVYLP